MSSATIRRLAPWALLVPIALAILLCAVVLAAPLAGFRVFVMTSGSMGATAPTGSLILSATPAPGTVVPGAVVTFRDASGRFVTHRVVRFVDGAPAAEVVVRGDVNAAADPAPVPLSRIVGVLRFTLPGAGYAIALARAIRPLLLLAAGLWLVGLVIRPTTR
jgi:signal peptidase